MALQMRLPCLRPYAPVCCPSGAIGCRRWNAIVLQLARSSYGSSPPKLTVLSAGRTAGSGTHDVVLSTAHRTGSPCSRRSASRTRDVFLVYEERDEPSLDESLQKASRKCVSCFDESTFFHLPRGSTIGSILRSLPTRILSLGICLAYSRFLATVSPSRVA